MEKLEQFREQWEDNFKLKVEKTTVSLKSPPKPPERSTSDAQIVVPPPGYVHLKQHFLLSKLTFEC
jgi:hypothetical protein